MATITKQCQYNGRCKPKETMSKEKLCRLEEVIYILIEISDRNGKNPIRSETMVGFILVQYKNQVFSFLENSVFQTSKLDKLCHSILVNVQFSTKPFKNHNKKLIKPLHTYVIYWNFIFCLVKYIIIQQCTINGKVLYQECKN
ncbi:Hypothetical_protein [Hexamita inflata]|uniref:Hypothetical_protein n=1 Tax=Hexamita inflata TaxID=28002 RepID=A0ABP1GHH9_9EUKA